MLTQDLSKNEYALITEEVSKSYGKKQVLNDISLSIKKGELYGLIGKNGSGKTTLLHVITGLVRKTKGEIYHCPSDGSKKMLEGQIAMVVDSPAMFYNLSAEDNLIAQCKILGLKSFECVEPILKLIGLFNERKKEVSRFSLGMKQRLGIGLALIGNPKFLILDEPVNGLDPEGIADLRKLLLHLNREKRMTILVSSHILSELSNIATCFGIMNNGKLICELRTEELLKEGKNIEEYYMAVMAEERVC